MVAAQNYYGMEDEPRSDAITTQIEALETQLRAAPAERTAEILGAAEQLLGAHYDDAERRGDKAAMQLASTAWQNLTALAEMSKQQHAVARAAVDLGKTVVEQRDQALEELDDLTTAIQTIDADNPLVAELMDWVDSTAAEGLTDYLNTQLTDGMIKKIEQALGCSHEEAWGMLRILTGDTPPAAVCDRFISLFIALKGKASPGGQSC